jgi:hypothetical protein
MTCEHRSELTAYVKGEVSPFEREALRLHLEECEGCAEEAQEVGRVLRALGRLPRIEPSAGFSARATAALVREHPEFAGEGALPRTGFFGRPALRVAGGLAAGFLVATLAGIFLAPRVPKTPDDFSKAGHVAGRVDPEYTPDSPALDGPGPVPRDPSPLLFLRHRTREERPVVETSPTPVLAGLRCLAGEQPTGGAWIGPDGSPSVGLTGLALLAFLGDGRTAASKEFGRAVRKAIEFLVWSQLPSGRLGEGREEILEDHAIAATALVEASLVSWDPALTAAAAKALAYGDYAGRGAATQFWRVLMLRLASLREEGGLVPGFPGGLDKAEGSPTGVAQALALFAGLVAKPPAAPEALARRASGLLERPALLGTERGHFSKNDLCLAHLGSLAMHQYGGALEARWLSPLRDKLIRTQEPAGSWPADFDPVSVVRGRVYATALAILILETPCRYPRMGE